MSEWKEYKLGEIAELRKEGFDPNGKLELPYIGLEHIEPSLLRLNSMGNSREVSSQKYKFYTKDILYGKLRPYFKKVHFSDLNGVCSTDIFVIKAKEKVDSRFLFYLIATDRFTDYANSGSTGTRMPRADWKYLKETIWKIPPLSTQTAIAEILSSLDDKIELNNAINKNLEDLAQALFKQWFVDFEFPNENGQPYRSSGGEMVESELGMIPKGWHIFKMDELVETVSKTYPLKEVQKVIFLNTGDIQNGKFLHRNFSDPKNLPGQAKKSITQNDILYSEIRPANKRFAYVFFDSSQYVVSTKLMVLRSKIKTNSLFQYFVLTQDKQIEYLQHLAESRSGTFPQITFSEISTIKISLPPLDFLNKFIDSAICPFYHLKFQVEDENQQLISLRDTLLPKLISGELTINQAEEMINDTEALITE